MKTTNVFLIFLKLKSEEIKNNFRYGFDWVGFWLLFAIVSLILALIGMHSSIVWLFIICTIICSIVSLIAIVIVLAVMIVGIKRSIVTCALWLWSNYKMAKQISAERKEENEKETHTQEA